MTNFNQYSSFTIKGKGKDEDLSIYLVYRSPNSSNANNEILFETMKNVKTNSIIIGDFNLPNIDWKLDKGYDSKSKLFLEAVDEAQLTQLVDFPTHIRGNLLDLVLTNTPEKILNIDCLGNLGNSDHSILSVDVLCSTNITKNEEYIPDWSKGNKSGLQDFFSSIDWDHRFNNKNTEDTWNTFCDIITEGVDTYIPKTLKNRSGRPKWSNRNIVRLSRKKEKLWKVYMKTKSNINLDNYKRAEKETKRAVQSAKRKTEKNLANNENVKGFYSYIKSKTKTRENIGPLNKMTK